MILQRVSPVTHSIGNCLKRVIVIVASVIFFQNPMGRQNMIGAPTSCLPEGKLSRREGSALGAVQAQEKRWAAQDSQGLQVVAY